MQLLCSSDERELKMRANVFQAVFSRIQLQNSHFKKKVFQNIDYLNFSDRFSAKKSCFFQHFFIFSSVCERNNENFV